MTEKDQKRSQEINLDRILIEEIGQFGKFQVLTILLIAVTIFFGGHNVSEYLFTAGRIPIRCLIPECDSAAPEWEPPWLGSAVPGAPGSYAECARRPRLNASAAPEPPAAADACAAHLFDQTTTVRCEQYVYNRTNTIVYDFGLECNEWKRTFVGSARVIGFMVLLPVNGFISDRWGRRVVLSFSAFASASFGLLRAFVNSYEAYVFLQALENAFQSYGTGAILSTEFVGPKFRVVAGPILSCFAALGMVSAGLLAWAVQDWRKYTIVIFAPQLITIGLYWVLPESVRWLISKGKLEEAKKVLKRAARINKRTLSVATLKSLSETRMTEKKLLEEAPKEPMLLIQILRSRVMLYRCCVIPVWWISTIMVYYGLSINASSLSGNQYVNFVLVTAIEIPGFITAMLVLNRLGRKWTIFAGFLVCSGCQFAFAFLGQDYRIARMALYLLGKYCISVVVTSVYVYTQELTPTKCRQSLVSFSSMMGRIGGIIAPLTPALMMYWEGIPAVMFGSLTLLSAALVLTTPETLGTELPDTIHQAERISKPYQGHK